MRTPVRPPDQDLDPVATLAAGLLAAVTAAPFVDGVLPLPWLALAALIGASVAAYPRWSSRPSGISLPALLLGISLGALTVASVPQGPALHGAVSIEGVVAGAPTGREADVAVTRAAKVAGPWTPLEGRVRVRFLEAAPAPGTVVLVHGDAAPLDPPALPGAPDPVRAAARSGVRTLVVADSEDVDGAHPRPPDDFDGARYGGVLRAMATGDRADVDEETKTLLRRTGTGHLLSISGFHVGIVALLVGGSARWLLRLAALKRPEGLPDAPAWLAGAVAGALYAYGAGAPASAQRAAWMLVFGAVAHATGREVRPLTLLGAAAIAVVVPDPAVVGSAAFQLSFGALAGLCRVTPWVMRWLPPDQPWIVRKPYEALAATIGATIGTLPASLWWFQELPPWSPIANLVALPWTSLTVVPLALAGGFAPEPVAGWAAHAGDLAFTVLVDVLRPLAVAPWIVPIGPVTALAGAAVLALPRRPVLVGAVLLVLLGTVDVPKPAEGLVVTFLDVGQGDGALVEWPDGRTMLVDGGPEGDAVLQYLRRRGFRRLDRVVASHGHPDHTGGLLPVLQSLDVGELDVGSGEGVAELVAACAARGTRVVVRPPDSVLPTSSTHGHGPNDRSLVVVVPWAGRRVLFPGDSEKAEEGELLARAPPVDLLKVPHHGSRTSSSEALLRALSPTLAVASMGRENRFGHPNQDVVDRYASLGIPFLRTDRLGTVEVTVTSEAALVRSWRAGAGWSAVEAYPWRPLPIASADAGTGAP